MNKNKFAITPPMGWNSYDYYDTTVKLFVDTLKRSVIEIIYSEAARTGNGWQN